MRSLGDMSFGSSQIKYRYLILLIVESGVFIAISKTIEFILFELSPNDGLDGNNALYIVMDCMPQVMVSYDRILSVIMILNYFLLRVSYQHSSFWQLIEVSPQAELKRTQVLPLMHPALEACTFEREQG